MITREMLIKKSVLKYWLLSDKETLFHAMRKNVIGEGDERHVFIDNNADILCVAHLDTVQKVSTKIKLSQNKLKASGLDDRLGAYLCAIMPTLGMNADILFTDNEEIGKSTAQYFNTNKEYKWVIEFDRMGSDAVTYGLNSPEWLEALKKTGVDTSIGSFSDLCYLKLPGDPCMVNFGIGYYEPHSVTSYARLQELVVNMNRFKMFYDQNKDKYYEQENKLSKHKGAQYEKTETVKMSKSEIEKWEDDMEEYYANRGGGKSRYECFSCGNVENYRVKVCTECRAVGQYFSYGDFA